MINDSHRGRINSSLTTVCCFKKLKAQEEHCPEYWLTQYYKFQKEFADNNFKFDENGRKLSKRVEKKCRKRRNCLLRAISPFPRVFSKGLFPRGIKRCHCVGMGLKNARKSWIGALAAAI